MLLLILLLFFLLMDVSSALKLEPSQYPSEIRLKAGVIHAAPMAYIHEDNSILSNHTTTNFSGFQIDMLERLTIFAAQDGVHLVVELEKGPQSFGDAFNLIANDCNTTSNPNALDDCQRYDLIVGDFYVNAERYMRADLSPAWLRTTMSTIKYIDKEEGIEDFTTLSETEAARATVCVPKGTYLAQVVQEKFPNNQYLPCDNGNDECIDWLKNGDCVLFADDELLLHHRASNDPSLEVTGESFNTQYVVWPMKENMPWPVSKLMKKWIYKAVQNATLDELYFQYFKKALCPIGTAGEQCELPCDPDHGAPDKRGVCICKSTKWTGYDCSIEVPEELNMLPPTIVTICYLLAGVNYVLVAICGVWLFMNRKRAHVKMAQPIFLMLILIGCVISTSTIFAMAQEHEGHGPVQACAAIPWLYSVGFCLTFGALYAKIRRIYALLQSAVRMQRVTISARETLHTVALVLAIDVVFLTAWTVVDPLKWKRTVTSTDVFGVPLESDGYCESEYQAIFGGLIATFHFLLMAVACYRCYLARRIPERISNGSYVAIAMFSNLQIFIVVIPVLILLGTDQAGVSFFVMSGAIWINDLVVLSLIFGSIMYKIYTNDLLVRGRGVGDKTMSKKASHRRISDEIRKYAETMRGLSRGISFRLSNAVKSLDFSSRSYSSRRDSSERQKDPFGGRGTSSKRKKGTELDRGRGKVRDAQEGIAASSTLEKLPDNRLDESEPPECADVLSPSNNVSPLQMPSLDDSESVCEGKPPWNYSGGGEQMPAPHEQSQTPLANAVSLFSGWSPLGQSFSNFEIVMKSLDDELRVPEPPGDETTTHSIQDPGRPQSEMGLQPHQGEGSTG